MTSIVAYDSRGGVAYRFTTPRNLTPEEVEQDLKEWAVDKKTHKIVVNGAQLSNPFE